MKHFREILNNEQHAINITEMWAQLRQRQYYNAMCELLRELNVLSNLPNLDTALKEKVERSYEKVALIVERLKDKLAS